MIDTTISTGKIDEALQIAYSLSDECKMIIQSDKVCFPAAHESISAFAEVTLQSAAFRQYNCEEQTIGLPLGKVEKILSNASSDDYISIETNDHSNRISIEVDKQKYKISPINLESMSSRPNLDPNYSTHIELMRNDLSQAVSAANIFSEHAAFNYTEAGDLIIKSTGDTDDIQTLIPNEDLMISSGNPAEVNFGLDMLDNLCQSIPLESTVSIMLEDNRPGLFEYEVAGGDGYVRYFLAPRIIQS